MINKSITENNKKRPIIGRLICRNNQKQIPLASESKNEMEKGTILIVDDNKGVLASLELLLETEFSEIKTTSATASSAEGGKANGKKRYTDHRPQERHRAREYHDLGGRALGQYQYPDAVQNWQCR